MQGINAKFCGKLLIQHISRSYFWILITFFVFVSMGVNGSNIFKMLLIPQLWFFFQKKKKVEHFLNIGPYGSEIVITLLLLQLWFFFIQTFSEYSVTSWHFKFQICEKILKFNTVNNVKMKDCQYFRNDLFWSKTEWNLGLGRSCRIYMGYLVVFKLVWGHLVHFYHFLSLLDYISRAHEIEIRPSSVRPSLSLLSLNLIRGLLLNFGSCFPWAIRCVMFSKKKKSDCLRFVFVFVNKGTYGSENFKTLLLQIVAESIQTFP